jgi:hypothetical protein
MRMLPSQAFRRAAFLFLPSAIVFGLVAEREGRAQYIPGPPAIYHSPPSVPFANPGLSSAPTATQGLPGAPTATQGLPGAPTATQGLPGAPTATPTAALYGGSGLGAWPWLYLQSSGVSGQASITPEQAQRALSEYYTNAAEAATIPSSGPGSEYFTSGAQATAALPSVISGLAFDVGTTGTATATNPAAGPAAPSAQLVPTYAPVVPTYAPVVQTYAPQPALPAGPLTPYTGQLPQTAPNAAPPETPAGTVVAPPPGAAEAPTSTTGETSGGTSPSAPAATSPGTPTAQPQVVPPPNAPSPQAPTAPSPAPATAPSLAPASESGGGGIAQVEPSTASERPGVNFSVGMGKGAAETMPSNPAGSLSAPNAPNVPSATAASEAASREGHPVHATMTSWGQTVVTLLGGILVGALLVITGTRLRPPGTPGRLHGG